MTVNPDDQVKIANLSHDEMYKCQRAYDLVKTYYFNDSDKAFLWFYTKNEHFDNNLPKDLLIHKGGVDKLLKYIEKNMVH